MHGAELGIGATPRVGDPLIDKPAQVVCIQPPTVTFLLNARCRQGHVGIGIGEHHRRRRVAPVAHAGGPQHSERAASAVTSQSDPGRGVTAKSWQVVQCPPTGAHGVLDGGRPGMLGRPPVIHCQHSSVRDLSKPTADGIVRLKISNHEAATVQVQR